jgi:hypothetical protein
MKLRIEIVMLCLIGCTACSPEIKQNSKTEVVETKQKKQEETRHVATDYVNYYSLLKMQPTREERKAEIQAAQEAYPKSPFVFRNDEVTTLTEDTLLTKNQERQFRLIKKAYSHIRGIGIPQDSRVIVLESDKSIIVLFEYKSALGVRGPNYSARVTIDPETEDVIQFLMG